MKLTHFLILHLAVEEREGCLITKVKMMQLLHHKINFKEILFLALVGTALRSVGERFQQLKNYGSIWGFCMTSLLSRNFNNLKIQLWKTLICYQNVRIWVPLSLLKKTWTSMGQSFMKSWNNSGTSNLLQLKARWKFLNSCGKKFETSFQIFGLPSEFFWLFPWLLLVKNGVFPNWSWSRRTWGPLCLTKNWIRWPCCRLKTE